MEPRNPSREELEQRVARFDQLQPMSTSKDLADIPQDAKDIIFARTLMPVILEKTKNPFGDAAAIYGAAGTTMNVSVCPPGQGPCLHSHNHTYETFMVLEGAFEFSVGDEGQETLTLNKWDVFSCPPGMYRGFRNIAETNTELKEQMETNAETYDAIAQLVTSDPQGELDLSEEEIPANDEK